MPKQSKVLKKTLEIASTFPKELDLSWGYLGTRLSFAEWKELMPLIHNNPNLEKLDLSNKTVR